jgi:hypothetical protein
MITRVICCLSCSAGPQNDIIAKLEALSANRQQLQGTPYAMSDEDFEKAKLAIMTTRF